MRTMIFVLMLVSLAIANEPKVVQVPKDFLLLKHWVGPVKIGKNSNVEGLYRIYNRDWHVIRLIDRHFEGSFTPGIQVYVHDFDIPAFVAGFRWQRADRELTSITVYDRRFKTAQGIGVGSTLGKLRQYYEISEIYFGEGLLAARVPKLAMSFILATPIPKEWWDNKDPTLFPDDAPIVSVWVRGD